MIDVLKGRKKYLPLSASSGYDLSYFRKGETLTKNYIINKMMENNVYNDYLPDGIDFTKLSRKFLLSVRILNFIFIQLIAYNDPNLYKQLYSIQKIQAGSKYLNKWKDYTTEIKAQYLEKLNQFIAIESNGDGKKSKAFRLKKNGQDTNIFKKINQGNAPQDLGNIPYNQNLNNIIEESQHNNQNVIHINLRSCNNIMNGDNDENNVDFE